MVTYPVFHWFSSCVVYSPSTIIKLAFRLTSRLLPYTDNWTRINSLVLIESAKHQPFKEMEILHRLSNFLREALCSRSCQAEGQIRSIPTYNVRYWSRNRSYFDGSKLAVIFIQFLIARSIRERIVDMTCAQSRSQANSNFRCRIIIFSSALNSKNINQSIDQRSSFCGLKVVSLRLRNHWDCGMARKCLA